MRFVGLALISALAASGAAWGCQNAQPPSPSVREAPALPVSPADNMAAGAEQAGAASPGTPGSPSSPERQGIQALGSENSAEPTSRVRRVALQGNERLLPAGDAKLPDERLSENVLGETVIGDVLIGDGEPMDDVDDAAYGVAEPDPDQAGAPSEPPSLPGPASRSMATTGKAQAEPQGTAPENQQAR